MGEKSGKLLLLQERCPGGPCTYWRASLMEEVVESSLAWSQPVCSCSTGPSLEGSPRAASTWASVCSVVGGSGCQVWRRCAVHSVCSVCSVFSVCSVSLCSVFTMQCGQCVQCTVYVVYSVQCAVCVVWSVFSVQCSVCYVDIVYLGNTFLTRHRRSQVSDHLGIQIQALWI